MYIEWYLSRKDTYNEFFSRGFIYFVSAMLFMNISSDYVQILDDQDEQLLPRNGIENTL